MNASLIITEVIIQNNVKAKVNLLKIKLLFLIDIFIATTFDILCLY